MFTFMKEKNYPISTILNTITFGLWWDLVIEKCRHVMLS